MKAAPNMQFTKDLKNNKIQVIRIFSAPVDRVWACWTESELLDQWWAPRPWKTETKHLDFRVGGYWLYAMFGPDGTRHWSRADFREIVPRKSFEGTDYFCDENGVRNPGQPTSNWHNEFRADGKGTKVIVTITFSKVEDLQTLVAMGFEAGFTAALGNLDEYLQTHGG